MTHVLGSARRRRPLARLLLDAVDDDTRGNWPQGGYPGVTVDALARALFIHKVGPAVHVHMDGSDAAPSLRAVAKERYDQQIERQAQVAGDIAVLAEVLSDLGVAWATVKGPVLAERLWNRPDLRQYADLDIVVDRRRLGDVVDALLGAGAEMIDRNWVLMHERVQGELSMRLAHGTSLDLHWHLVNNAELRKVFRFPMDDVLARVVDAKVGGVAVPTLDDADTLLHLAYHTAHSGGHRLMWLMDVACAAAVPALDWDAVESRASAYGVMLPLGVVLARVKRTVGLPVVVPARVRRAMRSPWSRITGAGDLIWPAPVLPADKLSGQIVYKSTRATGGASLGAALRSATHRPDRAAGPIDNVLHSAVGGADDRARYFARVRAEETE